MSAEQRERGDSDSVLRPNIHDALIGRKKEAVPDNKYQDKAVLSVLCHK